MKFFCKFLFFLTPILLFGQENTYDTIIKTLRSGKVQEAISICEKEIKTNPSDPRLYGYLSFAYYTASQKRSAEIDMDALRTRGIKRGDSYMFKENESMKDFMKVKLSFNQDTLKLSENAMLKAISLQRNNLDFLISLGEIYFSQSRHNDLIKLVDSVCMIFPKNPTASAVSRFAIGYFNRREYTKAADIYKILITRYSDFLNAYTDGGATLLMAGDPETAQIFLQQAHKMAPSDSLTLEYLSQTAIFLQKAGVAGYYKSMLYESDSSNINILRDMAFITFVYDHEASLDFFKKYLSSPAATVQPESIKQIAEEIKGDLESGKDEILVHLMRAEKLKSAGYLNYALLLLNRVVGMDNSNSPAYFDMAVIYREMNMYRHSIKYFSLCEELTQDLGKSKEILVIVYYEKAKTYFLMKDYRNVVKYIKLSMEKFGKERSELHYILGLAYLYQNDKESAKNEFNLGLKIADDKKIVEQSKLELESLK